MKKIILLIMLGLSCNLMCSEPETGIVPDIEKELKQLEQEATKQKIELAKKASLALIVSWLGINIFSISKYNEPVSPERDLILLTRNKVSNALAVAAFLTMSAAHFAEVYTETADNELESGGRGMVQLFFAGFWGYRLYRNFKDNVFYRLF